MNNVKISTANTIITILLFTFFSASVFIVLTLGLKSYNSTCINSELSFNERTCVAYISERLRQGDSNNAVSIGEFGGQNAIFIDTEYDGTPYSSIIYFNEGWLRELLVEKDASSSLVAGTKIAQARFITFSEPEPGLFFIEITSQDDSKNKLHIYVRSGGKT